MIRTDGCVFLRAVRSLVFGLSLVLPAAAQGSGDSKDEVFEAVDPYTGAERAGLDRAGYLGRGPFPLWDGARTQDVEEAIGRRVLWVETAHFKVGSTLETYKTGKGEPREEKRLKAELERLRPKLLKFAPPAGKLDPWLRLHLYAQRVEEEYAGFSSTFGLKPVDFPDERAALPPGEPLGKGPYLGQARKFVVLLLEKKSHSGRLLARWFKPTENTSARERMPGGGLILTSCAEVLASYGYEQDAALYATVASDLTLNFVDGFRDRGFHVPNWWKYGLAHVASRRVDEKLSIYAFRADRSGDVDAWKWEPRVLGLVQNGYAPSWENMMKLDTWEQMNGAAHMCVWSRVSWLLESKAVDPRGWLVGLARDYPNVGEQAIREARHAHERELLFELAGKTPAGMDEAWRQWVLRKYKK